MASNFDSAAILSYLGLPLSDASALEADPVHFLRQHIKALPPQLLSQFSNVTTPKQRTVIPTIRNRRLRHQFTFDIARSQFPALWEGRGPSGHTEGEEEKQWAQTGFLEGSSKHVGNLGKLLGEYEEEREAERTRLARRQAAEDAFVPEEDESDSDSDSDIDARKLSDDIPESEEEQRAMFLRKVKEVFIYGMLQGANYDAVDWNDELDGEDEQESQDRWFDEESEGE